MFGSVVSMKSLRDAFFCSVKATLLHLRKSLTLEFAFVYLTNTSSMYVLEVEDHLINHW